MLVSHKNRFVFVHNPKVAGTSVRNMLAQFECEDYRFGARVDGVLQDQSHLRIDQWPQWLWNLYIEGYYFFGFVRDPRDRFLSSISEFTYQHSDLFHQTGVGREKFLQLMLHPNSIAYDVRFVHFTEQWRFFDYEPVAKNLDIDVFKFEGINDVIAHPEFMSSIGASEPLVLQNDRPSFYRSEIPSALEELVPFLYREDYRRYGYEAPEMLFQWHTHSHRLEFVHRFPELVDKSTLNQREMNAFNRDKPEIESTSLYMMRQFIAKANELRNVNKQKQNV